MVRVPAEQYADEDRYLKLASGLHRDTGPDAIMRLYSAVLFPQQYFFRLQRWMRNRRLIQRFINRRDDNRLSFRGQRESIVRSQQLLGDFG